MPGKRKTAAASAAPAAKKTRAQNTRAQKTQPGAAGIYDSTGEHLRLPLSAKLWDQKPVALKISQDGRLLTLTITTTTNDSEEQIAAVLRSGRHTTTKRMADLRKTRADVMARLNEAVEESASASSFRDLQEMIALQAHQQTQLQATGDMPDVSFTEIVTESSVTMVLGQATRLPLESLPCGVFLSGPLRPATVTDSQTFSERFCPRPPAKRFKRSLVIDGSWFQVPVASLVFRGRLYVVDQLSGVVQYRALSEASSLQGNGKRGRFKQPCDIVEANGLLYIANTDAHEIVVTDLELTVVRRFPTDKCPYSLAVTENEIFVTNYVENGCVAYGLDGKRIPSFALKHPQGFGPVKPTSVAVLGSRVYVVDVMGNRVCIYEKDGSFVGFFDSADACAFYRPRAVCAFGADKIVVAHPKQNRITVHGTDGEFLENLEGIDPEVNHASPRGVSACGDKIYVSDTNAHRVCEWTYE